MPSEVKRYRRRPEFVDAILWTGDNIEAVVEFMAPVAPRYMAGFSNADDLIGTPDGVANKGDYIVKRPGPGRHEVRAMRPADFEALYVESK